MPEKALKTVVQTVLIDETGDSYYRMRWPGMQLAAQSGWRVINIDARAAERFAFARAADLLVLYQSHDPELLSVIAERKAAGRKTLVEYNDNFYEPPPASPAAAHWNSPLVWQTYETFMEESDGVIVTGPGLLQLFKEKTEREVYVLENHLPEPPPAFDQCWTEPEKELRIGWAGSLGHIADLLSLVPIFKELLDRHPHITLCFMGNESIPSVLGLPQQRISYTPWGSMQQYYQFWKDIHIGIAPLIDTGYNRCRSDVKALEMSSRAVLPILSDALPYKDFIAETDAPVFHTFAGLRNVLEKLIKKPDELKGQVKRCYDYVVAHRVGPNRRERLQLYENMMAGASADFNWPLGSGYHEFQGTTQEKSGVQNVLESADKLLKQNNHEQALALLSKALQQIPLSSEIAVNFLRLFARTDSKRCLTEIKEFEKRFPRDLRIRLIELNLLGPEERLKLWLKLAGEIKKAPAQALEFFRDQLIRVFVAHFRSDIGLLPTGLALLDVYPNSAGLRFEIASALERTGKYKAAREHFEFLSEALYWHGHNKEFLDGVQKNYIESWRLALETRVKGKFD